MIVEDDFTNSDFLTCDYLECGEAECFDLGGESSCICVDTLSPPDVHGMCHNVDTVVAGSGLDFRVDDVIPINPGMPLWNDVNREFTESSIEIAGVPEVEGMPGTTEVLGVPGLPEVPKGPDVDLIPSTYVYIITGLLALLLLAIGLFVLIYVTFAKLRRAANADLEAETSLSTKTKSASESLLLVQNIQEKKLCPFRDSEVKKSLDHLPSSEKIGHTVGNFGTFGISDEP